MYMDTLPAPHLILSLTSAKRSNNIYFRPSSISSRSAHKRTGYKTPYASITSITSDTATTPVDSILAPKAFRSHYHQIDNRLLLCYLASKTLEEDSILQLIANHDSLHALAVALCKNPYIKSFTLSNAQSPQAWIYSRWPDGPAFYWKQQQTPLLNLQEFCASQNLRSLAYHFKEPITPSFHTMAQIAWHGYLRQDASPADDFSRLPLGEMLHVNLHDQSLRITAIDGPAKLQDYVKKHHEEEACLPTQCREELSLLGVSHSPNRPILQSLLEHPDIQSPPLLRKQIAHRIAQGELNLLIFLTPTRQRVPQLLSLPIMLNQCQNLEMIYGQLWKQSPWDKQLCRWLLDSPKNSFIQKCFKKLLNRKREQVLSSLYQPVFKNRPITKILMTHLNNYYQPTWDLIKLLGNSLPYVPDDTLTRLHSDYIWNVAPVFAKILPESICSHQMLLPFLASEYIQLLKTAQFTLTREHYIVPRRPKKTLLQEGFIPKTLSDTLEPQLNGVLTALELWCNYHIDMQVDELFHLCSYESKR